MTALGTSQSGASCARAVGLDAVKIDACDADLFAARRWRVSRRANNPNKFHVLSCGRLGEPETVYLHRLIMRAPPGMQVDHINGDPLDNRRSNLRLATHGQNMANRAMRRTVAPYRGIGQRKDGGSWRAIICHEGKVHRSRWVRDPEDAAREYDRMARALHKEFALPNFAEDAGA